MSGLLGHRGLLLAAALPLPAPEILLHFDGTNGATSFVDSSPNAHTITRYAGALSNAQAKFGATSYVASGSGCAVAAPSPTPLRLATGDFILDLWVHQTSATGNQSLIWTSAGNGNRPFSIHVASGVLTFQATNPAGSGLLLTQGFGTLTLNAWQHVRVSRAGAMLYLFKGGALQYSGSHGNFWAGDSSTKFAITDASWYGGFQGYIDEVAVFLGASCTADFAVPTAPYAP